jgi:hypothetical protein
LRFLTQQGQDRGADISAPGAMRSLRAFAEGAASATPVHRAGLGAAAAAAAWFALAIVGHGFAVCWHTQDPLVAVAPAAAGSAFGAFPAVTALPVWSGFFVVLVVLMVLVLMVLVMHEVMLWWLGAHGATPFLLIVTWTLSSTSLR